MISIQVFCKRKQKTKEVIWCSPGSEGVGRVITMHFIFRYVSLPRQICLMGRKDKYTHILFSLVCACLVLVVQQKEYSKKSLHHYIISKAAVEKRITTGKPLQVKILFSTNSRLGIFQSYKRSQVMKFIHLYIERTSFAYIVLLIAKILKCNCAVQRY